MFKKSQKGKKIYNFEKAVQKNGTGTSAIININWLLNLFIKIAVYFERCYPGVNRTKLISS
jgi:hypothetical protein